MIPSEVQGDEKSRRITLLNLYHSIDEQKRSLLVLNPWFT